MKFCTDEVGGAHTFDNIATNGEVMRVCRNCPFSLIARKRAENDTMTFYWLEMKTELVVQAASAADVERITQELPALRATGPSETK